MLDELAVLDAGGAGGFAGAAVEAFVDVLDEGFGDFQASGFRRRGRVHQRGRRRQRAGLRLGLVGGADGGEVGLSDVDHLVDAAAGGVSLQIPKAIGGAGVETDAAVDAAGEVFVRGILAGDWGGGGHFRRLARFLVRDLLRVLGYEKR